MDSKMKFYKLKKLPVTGDANYANLGQLQRRVENMEAILNLLDIRFATNEAEGVHLPKEVEKLFEETTPPSLPKSL